MCNVSPDKSATNKKMVEELELDGLPKPEESVEELDQEKQVKWILVFKLETIIYAVIHLYI